jgi:DGQHR domain-containing protein
MAKGASNNELEPTAPVDAVFGAFDLGAFRIPYLSCVLTGSQCDSYLQLVSDDPQFTLANGRIEELFQRDIDEERVADMERFYINSDTAKRPAFFNSITVALLVKPGNYPPPAKYPQDVNQYTGEFGPIRISWERADTNGLPCSGSFGCVYWNKCGVHAVAIDGQHRLAAIKRLNRHPAKAKQLGVSILLLVLDKGFGLKAQSEGSFELVRQLFIDLNKHAQKVSRARQLLLDDADPIAIALRRTVGPELNYEPVGGQDGLSPGKNGEFVDCLPLELVDWHGEQKAKVDRGPYATSVLALEWALLSLCKSRRFGRRLPMSDSALFDTSNAMDTSDADAESDEYARTRKYLSGWLQDVEGLKAAIDDAEQTQLPFSLSASARRRMGDVIYDVWGRGVVHLLSMAGPYRVLAEFRARKSLLSAAFGGWYQAVCAHKVASAGAKVILKVKLDEIEANLRDKFGAAIPASYERSVKHIEDKIKCVCVDGSEPEPNLLFYLTGQRSMILALRWLFESGQDEASAARIAEEFGWNPPKTRGEEVLVFARALASAVDHWSGVESGFMFTKVQRCPAVGRFPRHFWQGSILKRESPDAIDFSTIAAERGARMVYLLTASWMFKQINPAIPGAVRDAIRRWAESGNSTELTALDSGAVGRHLKRALILSAGFDQFAAINHDANKFPFAFLAKMQVSEETPFSAEDHREMVKRRVKWILERAGGEAD